jgi:hypothetical protein
MASFADELHAANSRVLRTAIPHLKDRFFHEFLPGCRHPRGKLRNEPVNLYDYQKDMVEEFFEHQVNIWEVGRQGAKTSTAGLILAFLSRELTGDAIISTFRMERSIELVGWVKDWCTSHTDPTYDDNLANDATDSAIFKTGFRAIALPHGQSARGYSTELVITDESQLMDDEDLSALLPTGLTTAPKRIHMGTVWGTSGWFWRLARDADRLGYDLTHKTSEEVLAPNGPIIKTELERLRLELGDLQYNQECLLIPIADIDTFFGQALVESCTRDYTTPTITPNTEIIVGFDHAVSGVDESVAFIGAFEPNGKLAELEVLAWHNTLIHDQVQELSKQYANAHYCIDGTAEGGKEAQGFFQRAGLDVLPIDFGKSKPTLMITHKNRMQQNLFKFQDERTRIQHLNYKFQESQSVKGRYKYGKPGAPDDRVDAAALADYLAFLQSNRGSGENAVIFVGEEL